MRDDVGELKVPEDCQDPTITIKTMIIMDFMGGGGDTPEEEAADIAETFEVLHNIVLDYDFAEYANNIHDKEYKLIIMDYGGVLPGCDDMVASQLREVTEWAQEHPSRLVVFWTAFTSMHWHYEIEDDFKDISNVLFYDPIDRLGARIKGLDIWEHQDKVIETIRILLG